MIIFRPIKHDGLGLKGVQILGVGEITFAEFFRDHAGLHDGTIKQIAMQHLETGVLLDRLVK